MSQSKRHKECVMGVKNKLRGSHNSLRESPIFRNGNIHFLDLEAHPVDNSQHRAVAVECECGSSTSQRKSNWKDLLLWKKKNPDGMIFQIESADEFDERKVRR